MRQACTTATRSIGAIAAMLVLPASALADVDGNHYGPGMMWDGGWAGWLMGPVMMVLVFAVLVVLVVMLVRGLTGQGGSARDRPGPSAPTAMDILRERFARGEIDREEFEDRKRILNG